jgi:iron complex outermembrane receptor protein
VPRTGHDALRLIFVTVLAFVGAWSAATSAAALDRAQIRGSVSDTTGGVLAGVSVVLRGAASATTETDVEGRFVFGELPPGDYQLVALLPGFVPHHRTLRLAFDETVVVDVTLSAQWLEQLVVTATKAGEIDALSAPYAISVLAGSELQRLGAHNLAQIAGLAPAVTFSQNTGFAQLTIRGIGTNAVFAGSDPSSAVYLDGVYLARPAMVLAEFLDLERIEVLRGPQGTLYGRNAVGGAVNVITRSPTDDVERSARFVVANYDALRFDARVSGPLVRGRLMASAAFLRGIREGFVDDLSHPNNPLGGEDVTAARGQVRAILTPRMELLVAADITHQDAVPLTWAKVLVVKPGYQVDNPLGLHQVRTSTKAEGRNLQVGASARLTANLATGARLTSLSAFRAVDYDRLVDTDITELELNATRVHETQHQVSQEVTVSYDRSSIAWLGGVFLFSERDRQPTHIRMAAANRENVLNPEVDATSQAVFGQATVRVLPALALTGGLRYSRERKDIRNEGRIQALASGEVIAGSAYGYTDTVGASPWTPKLGLELQLGGDSLAYVSATRGFKSGGFNLTSTERGRGYAPEWAWSYEAGVKSLVAAGRVTFAASAFRTSYKDLQVSTGIRPGVIDVSNAAEARINGVEVEGRSRPFPALEAGGHVAFVDARYDRYRAVGLGGVITDVSGNRLANAPEWSGRGWLAWSHVFGRSVVTLGADAIWQSRVFFSPFNSPVEGQRPYRLLHLNAEFGPSHRRWTVAAFARNVTNRDYITGTFPTPAPAIGGRPGDPRHVGLEIAIRR